MIVLNFKKDIRIFDKLISKLVILIPLGLVTGPLIPEMLVILINILFLYILFNNKNIFFQLIKNKFSIFFLIFFLVLLLSSLFSTNVLSSLSICLSYLRYGIFSLAVCYIFKKNSKIINHLFYVLLFIFIILIIDGYLQFFTGKNILGWQSQGTRISSFFKDELILDSFLIRFLPIFFFGLITIVKNKRKSNLNILFFITFVLIEVLIFMSGGRASFFLLNLSTLFCLIMFKNYKIYRFFILLTSFLFILIISYFFPKFKYRMIDQTFEQIGIVSKNTTKNTTNETRLNIFSLEHTNHYKSAYKMFLDNKIFGIGPRMYRENCKKKKYYISNESCSTHPHNYYVQILSELGFVGLIYILTLLIYFTYNLFNHFINKIYKKKYLFNDMQICLFSGLIIYFWPFIPTGGLFNNWVNIIFFFNIGLVLSCLKIYNKKI